MIDPYTLPQACHTPAERLRVLSRRIGRLSPNWRDPELYFQERDEIERELRHVAREVMHG